MNRGLMIVGFIVGISALAALIPAWLVMLTAGALGAGWGWWATWAVCTLVPMWFLRVRVDHR